MNILVVDDEEKIRELIIKYLNHEGYQSFCASNGREAIDIYSHNKIDLIIMDVMMPEIDGYETYKKIIEIDPKAKCIFLTALGEEYDKLYGFDLGAEDYVTKPFSPKELLARIKVALRKNENNDSKIIVGKLIIDENSHQISIDNKTIDLPNKEFELLLLLAKNKGNVLKRENIITKIWGYEYDSDDRTLDTHMKLLRKNLGEYGKYITTLRGVGYRFEKEI